MSDLGIPAVNLGDFAVSAALAEGALAARFSGTADISAREALESTLARVHAEAQRLRVERVVIDFQRLEFMNSSCFKSFVTWISEVQELAPEARYPIHFRSNPEMLWQRRSLHALRCFAVDLITIDAGLDGAASTPKPRAPLES